jgi:hypothetical protein
MSAPLAPTTPTIGLSLTEFTLNAEASFNVYGAALAGATNVTLSTTLPGITWNVSTFSSGTTSVQITATPQSNGSLNSTGGDDLGDLTVTVTTGSGTGSATYAAITYR